MADLENEKGWFQFIVALGRRKIFVGHAHLRSREDTYPSHDSASKLPLTLSARDAYIYMHKSGRVYFTERNGTERNGTQGYFTERTSVIAERLI